VRGSSGTWARLKRVVGGWRRAGFFFPDVLARPGIG
jgi:hypothetical protein